MKQHKEAGGKSCRQAGLARKGKGKCAKTGRDLAKLVGEVVDFHLDFVCLHSCLSSTEPHHPLTHFFTRPLSFHLHLPVSHHRLYSKGQIESIKGLIGIIQSRVTHEALPLLWCWERLSYVSLSSISQPPFSNLDTRISFFHYLHILPTV